MTTYDIERDFDRLYDVFRRMTERRAPAIPVLTGPTATGKSSMATRLAEERGLELVSCDAMQVYRHFDIGTAKPPRAVQARVRHHFIDSVEPTESISVAAYVEAATVRIRQLLDAGRPMIVCGGSVQYISALLDGLTFIDVPVDRVLRQTIAREIERRGVETSWEMIRALDPEAAEKIAPTDRRRIGRFFELYRQTGMTKTEHNRRSREHGPRFDFQAYWLDWMPRSQLYEAINDRVDRMFERGLVDEVRRLMDMYPDIEHTPAFRGIGYGDTVLYLQGRLSLEDARDNIKRSTRRYAKRQQTWLRRRDDLHRLILDRSDRSS